MPRKRFLELRHLHYFQAVADEQHFGRAAARLGIAQPPLSQQMQRLEATLGVALFDRSQRRVTLTAAGRALAARAPAVLEAAAALHADVRQASLGKTGVLRVGVGTSALLGILPEMIARFRARYPAVLLQLDDATSKPHEERVRQRLIDVALVREIAPIAGVRSAIVREERLLVVLPRAHRLARRRTLKLADLRDEPFVLFPRESSPSFYDELQAGCARAATARASWSGPQSGLPSLGWWRPGSASPSRRNRLLSCCGKARRMCDCVTLMSAFRYLP
jgi:DNA-binding transcriptional LysR family regulator